MIHKYSLKGHNIVLDVNSGAVHIVDDLTYNLLDFTKFPLPDDFSKEIDPVFSKYTDAEIKEALEEIEQLGASGALFSSDDYDIFAEKMVESPIKAMCLNVSHDCNLRCEYCFAGKGDYAGNRMVMSLDTAKSAIDFLIAHSEDRENLEVDFFGGEPLMNFGVVQDTISYARGKESEFGKRFRFTITTNGLLLDDAKTEYINREMSNVVLSLDGRKAVNDRVRAGTDGKGCYDDIVPKFQKLVAERGGKEYYVRGTFTRYNMDFADDVLALAALGFEQISVEPVVADSGAAYAFSESDIPKISEEYERLTDLLIDKKRRGERLNFFHYMLDLEQGPCAIKRLRGCGCGNEYVAVTPDGDIYPCHQFIGHDEWKMGSLVDNTFDLALKKRFSRNSVYQKPTCRECWAKFYCSGGCSANSMKYMGEISSPHEFSCKLEKKRLECAIAMKAELALAAV